jgi:hypothetical protein
MSFLSAVGNIPTIVLGTSQTVASFVFSHFVQCERMAWLPDFFRGSWPTRKPHPAISETQTASGFLTASSGENQLIRHVTAVMLICGGFSSGLETWTSLSVSSLYMRQPPKGRPTAAVLPRKSYPGSAIQYPDGIDIREHVFHSKLELIGRTGSSILRMHPMVRHKSRPVSARPRQQSACSKERR